MTSLPKHVRRIRKTSLLTTAAIVLVYSAFYRFAFNTEWMAASGGLVSISFILSVPFACGAVSVAIGRFAGSDNWIIHAIFLPVITLVLGLILCVITELEAAICVIMAAPILIVGAILGGLIAHAFLPKNDRPPGLQVTFVVFLPFLAAWLESTLHWPSETKSITNTIDIDAPAEQIWPEIASVSAIKPSEIRNSWIYQIGFPKPIAATLDHHRLGGIRVATFERGVSFFEIITDWRPSETLSFSIEADPAFIPRSAFDQHIIVGGRFYDVLDGTYRIEPLTENTSRLHLTSNHRLSTRFNSYAAWWSVRIMDQIQGTILEVIRSRSESL